MYYYLKTRRKSLFLSLLVLLCSVSFMSAQDVSRMNTAFKEELANAKAKLDLRNQTSLFFKYFSKELESTGKIDQDSIFVFSLGDITEFLTESEFFKVEKNKVTLPFLAKRLETIPHYVESGGLKFEALMGAKVEDKPALDYILACASKVYKTNVKNVELQYIWMIEDKKLLGGPNSAIVTSVDKHFQVNTLAITEASIEVEKNVGFGGLPTYVKKGDWKKRFGVQD